MHFRLCYLWVWSGCRSQTATGTDGWFFEIRQQWAVILESKLNEINTPGYCTISLPCVAQILFLLPRTFPASMLSSLGHDKSKRCSLCLVERWTMFLKANPLMAIFFCFFVTSSTGCWKVLHMWKECIKSVYQGCSTYLFLEHIFLHSVIKAFAVYISAMTVMHIIRVTARRKRRLFAKRLQTQSASPSALSFTCSCAEMTWTTRG